MLIDSIDKIRIRLFDFGTKKFSEQTLTGLLVAQEVETLKQSLTTSASNSVGKVIISTKLSSTAEDAKNKKIPFEEVELV